MKALIQLFCMIIAFALAAPAAWAGGGARISGVVTDPAGAAIAGATVRVVSRTGGERAVKTSRDGSFEVSNLPAGGYLVEISALGFRTETRPDLRLSDGQSESLDLAMSVSVLSEELTITAAGAPQAREETARAIDVVTRAEADARGEIALPEALTTVAGLRIQRQGGPGTLTSIRFRGLRNQDTSILVDNLRVRDASDLYGSAGSFFEDFLLANVDRIEVVRGAGSTLYGTNAIGGVVNLIPARGAVGAPRFEALVEGGSLGTVHGQFRSIGGTERIGYSFGFDQYNVRDGVDGDDDYRNTSVAGRVNVALNDRMMLTGDIQVSDNRLDLNGNPYFVAATSGGSIFPPAPVRFVDAPNDPDDFREGRLFQGALKFDHTVNSVWSYTARYSAVDTARQFLSGPDIDKAFFDYASPGSFDVDGDGIGDVSGSGNSEFEGLVQTVDVRNRIAIGRSNLLTAGFEVEHERFAQYFFGPFGSSRQPYNAYGFDYDFDGVNDASRDRQLTWAAFAFDQFSLMDGRLRIGLGVRWQGFSVGDTEALIGTSNTAKPEDARVQTVPVNFQGLDEKSAVTGDGSIAYTFGTGTRVWAHAGNSFRAPSLYERFSNVADANLVSSGLVRVGDPTLKPEIALSVDGGVEQAAFAGRLRAGATYFYTRLQRQIDFASFFNPVTFESDDPLGLGRFGGYVNTRGGLSRGVELTGAVSPWRSMDIKAAYTFVKSETILPSSIALEDGRVIARGSSYRAGGIPEHSFSLQAIQHIGRFTLAVDLLSQSEHDATLFDPVFFGSRRFTFDGYTRADVSANYTIPVSDRVAITVFGRVENLTDATIRENGTRLPGAAGFGGVKVKF